MDMRVGIVFQFLQHFFSSLDLLHHTVGVFLILAVEEFVQVVHGRNAVEVVFFRRVGGHPLEAARIPWIKRCHLALARCDDHVDEEQQNSECQHQ